MHSSKIKHESGAADAGYVSEFTQFMDGFLSQHPEVERDRRYGWNIFWDRDVDFDELKHASQDSVPAKAYSYF